MRSAITSSAAVPEPSSLMPGPFRHRVQVGADHDDVVGIAGLRLRDHLGQQPLGEGAAHLAGRRSGA